MFYFFGSRWCFRLKVLSFSLLGGPNGFCTSYLQGNNLSQAGSVPWMRWCLVHCVHCLCSLGSGEPWRLGTEFIFPLLFGFASCKLRVCAGIKFLGRSLFLLLGCSFSFWPWCFTCCFHNSCLLLVVAPNTLHITRPLILRLVCGTPGSPAASVDRPCPHEPRFHWVSRRCQT